MEHLFRKKALEKLRSPEQLDQLLRVTTPASWLALTALCIILVAALTWGFYGRVATKVSGTGITINPGGMSDIATTGNGEVVAIKFQVGDTVEKGRIVSELIDPTITKRILDLESKLRELRSDFARSSRLIEEEFVDRKRVLSKQRFDLQEKIGVTKNRIAWLEERIKILEGLFKEGLVTGKTLADRRFERDNSRVKVDASRKSLSDLIAQEVDLEKKKLETLSVKKLQINDILRSIADLRVQRDRVTEVRSLVSGRVTAILAQVGEVMRKGQPIMTVESQHGTMELDFYVSAFKAKRIHGRMVVQFTPATVKREEYGYLLCNVTEVSPFPSTSRGLTTVLEDPDLVKSLLAHGPVMSIRARFQRDPSTASGFKWSSRKGKNVRISSGTLGLAKVVVREQRPVELVIPTIKKWLGL